MYNPPGWVDSALEMNDDGIIYYYAKGARPYRKVFRQLERNTDLNFEPTQRLNKAEIVCTYEDINYAAGVTRLQDKFYVITDPDYKRFDRTYHVEAHEVGHALGLAHDPGYPSAMTTNWYDIPWMYTQDDYTAINELFF